MNYWGLVRAKAKSFLNSFNQGYFMFISPEDRNVYELIPYEANIYQL